ncbi:hypothetical protein BFJ63_vAg18034 [Fusarium oxysporum f. sp. narcissi]|uniref:Transcription factor domain-containing protein n=1 Tax=Fusarium oxysporum f. sp. narcissi TaxID=451672 RepID=A0A4Q2UZB4_FUSOX|nr:hypothetical protein BFJ63_vAg18034 [Fusarium oxysporum f. sp. narcissi]
MGMGLYDEDSLEGRDSIEETLLRNNFWQLYVCDKTAFVMKVRPVTIHETLLQTGLTLKERSPNSVSLFEPKGKFNSIKIQDRLLEGFHVIRRLWTMAARVIQGMELQAKDMDAFINMTAHRKSLAQLSEAYFEMITLTNYLPSLVRLAQESSPDTNRDTVLEIPGIPLPFRV